MSLDIRRVSHTPDPVSWKDFQDMLSSRAWRMYAVKIESKIEAERKRCENALSPIDEIRMAQYALKTLREVKDLPEVIRQEMMHRK